MSASCSHTPEAATFLFDPPPPAAGYLTANEREILENMEKKTAVHKTWVPFMWACKTVERARREGRVKDDVTQKTLTDEIIRLRGCCGDILGWDEYNIPLVYTQVMPRVFLSLP